MSIRGQCMLLGLSLLVAGVVPGVASAAALGVARGEAASPAAVEFSADTVQTDPQKRQRVGRIYVGTSRIRSEMEQNGQPVVNIIDTGQRITWVLYPQQRSYIEYRMETGETTAPESPCAGIPGARCKRLGDEPVDGRPASKWQVMLPSPRGVVESTQWIGKQRSFLLRQEIQGGAVMEQRLLAMEVLHGRPVEKWEMVLTQGEQPAQRSTRWFDPQLNLAIKEANPGGYVRELQNIMVGPQDPGLFKIPEQFKQIVPQPGQER
ncbi:hypothetical protein [Sedimenticola hydrogenitrophicus]|uniref:hypothetical protein n=1 Tax=Sedimenticola hydrogenitrophicus TaxID=2967975 RepID=UPI0023B04156|nr:hypothetical protein [Sedimenticola hydrogenitrophicus]